MEKMIIGVLDSRMNNSYLLSLIKKELLFNKLYYYNFYTKDTEYTQKELIQKTTDAFKLFKTNGVNTVLILSSPFVSIYKKCAQDYDFNILELSGILSSHVNYHFPQADLALFANDEDAKNPIYQRRLNAQHLYVVDGTRLEKAALLNEVKTDLSFALVREELKNLIHKSYNVMVFSSINSSLFQTEIKEYVRDVELIDTFEVLLNSLKELKQKKKYIDSLRREVIVIKNSDNIDLDYILKHGKCKTIDMGEMNFE